MATHIDAPYFWGASRQTVPQWLLACMAFSGLFQKIFINQVQVVGYLHSWTNADLFARNPTLKKVGGEFVLYGTADGLLTSLTAAPLSGNLVDGSKTVHAATVYRYCTALYCYVLYYVMIAWRLLVYCLPFACCPPACPPLHRPDQKAPFLDKNREVELRYKGDERWELTDLTAGGRVLRAYHSDDLRISLVYRARCFRSEEDKAKYKTHPAISISDILAVFQRDLAEKHGHSPEALAALSRLDLGKLIVNTYVKYPLPSVSESLNPFNYCALPMLAKWTEPFVAPFCT